MALLTTTISVFFVMPRDKELHDKFVSTHDLTEWDRRDTGNHAIRYVKEEVMDIKELDKF